MSDRPLSPLESIALQELPDDNRIKRIAATTIRGRFGLLPTHITDKFVADIVSGLNEPHGKRGALRKALRREIIRQLSIRDKRRNANRRVRYCRLAFFSVTVGLFHHWTAHERKTSLALKRIGKSYGPGALPYHDCIDMDLKVVPSARVVDAKLLRNGALALVTPASVLMSRGWCRDSERHRVRFLIYKVGDSGGAVRVPFNCTSVDWAIECLKTAVVDAAEEKGYTVEIDWAKQCFCIKAPNRLTPREIEFKRIGKTKKPKRELTGVGGT